MRGGYISASTLLNIYLPCESSIPLLSVGIQEKCLHFSPKDMYQNVRRNAIHNSSKLEMTQICINSRTFSSPHPSEATAGVCSLISNQVNNLPDLQMGFPLSSESLSGLLLKLFYVRYPNDQGRMEGGAGGVVKERGEKVPGGKIASPSEKTFHFLLLCRKSPQISGLNQGHFS